MTNLTVSDFTFELPNQLIARTPAPERQLSRLLHFDVANDRLNDLGFADIVNLIPDHAVLVYNNTKVIPARCFARRATGAKVEILFERVTEEQRFLAHVRSNRSLKPGTLVIAGEDKQGVSKLNQQELEQLAKLAQDYYQQVFLTTETATSKELDVKLASVKQDLLQQINTLIGDQELGFFVTVGRLDNLFDFISLNEQQSLFSLLQTIGHIPLPSYMEREDQSSDQERYQTVYAKVPGAVAAPTAGLHFTPEILQVIKAKGVTILEVTLHVGAGTFLPVKVNDIAQHQMHAEWLEISPETAQALNEALIQDRKIVCVGTTSVRSLETMVQYSIRQHLTNAVAKEAQTLQVEAQNQLVERFSTAQEFLTNAPYHAQQLYASWQPLVELLVQPNHLATLASSYPQVATVFTDLVTSDQLTFEQVLTLERNIGHKNLEAIIKQLQELGQLQLPAGHYADADFTHTYLNSNLKLGKEISLLPYTGNTEIFIYPGHKVHLADYLITNFHLPESTLIMLVASITGRDFCLRAYNHAIANNYRFYSYGDSCFIPNLKTNSGLAYQLP